jgi:hypothetical protein
VQGCEGLLKKLDDACCEVLTDLRGRQTVVLKHLGNNHLAHLSSSRPFMVVYTRAQEILESAHISTPRPRFLIFDNLLSLHIITTMASNSGTFGIEDYDNRAMIQAARYNVSVDAWTSFSERVGKWRLS